MQRLIPFYALLLNLDSLHSQQYPHPMPAYSPTWGKYVSEHEFKSECGGTWDKGNL